MRGPSFREVLPSSSRVCLDTSPLICHLEGVESYATLTTELFMRFGEGELTGFLSTITVAELLVKPFASSKPVKASLAESFLLTLPNCTIAPVTYQLAREAAHLRARYGLRMPDAIVAATALEAGATHLLTNDTVFRRIASLPHRVSR